jgi:hypothetical protein
MDWICSNKSPKSKKIDDSALQLAFEEIVNIANISMPHGALNIPAKQTMAEESLRWLRRNDPTLSDVNDATLSSLAKVKWRRGQPVDL